MTTITAINEQQRTWKTEKKWFSAHHISKQDEFYVSSVKFSKAAGIFITGTNHGEVRLWSAADCKPIGLLNSKNWSGSRIKSHIEEWTNKTK